MSQKLGGNSLSLRSVTGLCVLVAFALVACRTAPLSGPISHLVKSRPRPTLIVVLDGLRPDSVTPELMPNLTALARRGVTYQNHHSVFPTLTRVNAASLITGAHPSHHGLLGNRVYFPEVSARGLSTGDARVLMRIDDKTGGRLLTSLTLGEILAGADKRLAIVSAGSSGAAYIMGYRATAQAGHCAIYHPSLFIPLSGRDRVESIVGPVPPDAVPNTPRNRWAIDTLLDVALPDFDPDVAILWLAEPDHTSHRKGVGHPETLRATAEVDQEIGRLTGRLRESKRWKKANLIFISDHGFSNHTQGDSLNRRLVDLGLKESATSDDLTVVDSFIYLKNSDRERIAQIAETLLSDPAIGAILVDQVRPTHPEGFVPGTLSFHAAKLNHERAGDLLVLPRWSNEAGEYGVAGTSTSPGIAGHGSASPYDIRNVLIAVGPDFKRGASIELPSSNLDIAPTVCRLMGIDPPDSMDGRVLGEALRRGPRAKPKALTRIYRSRRPMGDVEYTVEMKEMSVDGTAYLDWIRTLRTAPAPNAN